MSTGMGSVRDAFASASFAALGAIPYSRSNSIEPRMPKPKPKSKPKPKPKPKLPATDKRAAIKVRRWKKTDIPSIVECQRAAYPDYADGGLYDARIYELQLAAFPEGQFLAEQGGRVIGYATSLLLQLDDV
ncbi:MAG: hypothetical protein KDI21_23790, partial [Halieaceae bacterium]|nr:hypothetical protein [Halieaceae bacterium]